MIWKVTPKTFTDEVGQERTIVGIIARLVSPIDFNLEEFKELALYLGFQTSTETIHGERNVYTKDFVLKLTSQGVSEVQAKAQVKAIIKNICFGNSQEMYQSAIVLAQLYGYTLLPITEQGENEAASNLEN